jgi:hypothetical protein
LTTSSSRLTIAVTHWYATTTDGERCIAISIRSQIHVADVNATATATRVGAATATATNHHDVE